MRFFSKIADIWRHEELRNKIGITLGLILVYRIGSFIVLPGVNSDVLAAQMSSLGSGGLGDILSLFTGGAFTRASIFALGIMPYISASIIVQLMSIAVPAVQKLQSEGESGRKKITQWTRFLTIAIALVQAPGYIASTVVSVPGAVVNPSTFWWFSAIMIIVSSTLVIMWLGERITEKGIGNGISLLITVGILSRLPGSFFAEFGASVGQGNLIKLVVEMVAFMVVVYLIGVTIGCAMGFFGGVFDLVFQRIIEIWSNIPFLYMVIIIFSVIPNSISIPARISILLMVMVLFSWTSMTYYMRTETYKEKARDYVAAARIIGASNTRIIFRHILPNVISTLVTFMPFTIIGAISAITALDYLGFGLPPPTPSLGELLKQGTSTLRTAPWIVTSSFGTLVVILTLVTFVGEAIRESFDPKKFTIYR